MLRQPIVAIMGHVDHGKTTVLDTIRGSAIAKGEAGGITQAIGASIIPIPTIKKVCGSLLKALKKEFTLPGLLFIDTPGHAAFTNLRKRGGNLADIAILVIDINEGIKPQTLESIQILKKYKTPFIIAANKIDVIGGWKKHNDLLLQNISLQSDDVQKSLDKKIYELVGKLYELEFPAERFDRIEDHTKQIAIVPISAITSEGIPELLMVLTGLAQKFLEKSLDIDVKGPAKGTILEIKEEKGLGTVADTIIYDGTLQVGDKIVIGSMHEPVVTKIKGLFLPAPLAEMRDKKSKYKSVKNVTAATGVRILAQTMDGVVSGMPMQVANTNTEEIIQQIQKEIEEVLLETDKNGVILKADSLGSLEAALTLLKENSIPVKKANVGAITKKDISDANANKDPLHKIILGFNIPMVESNIKIITHNVIYRLIDGYTLWKEAQQAALEKSAMDQLVKPCKIQVLKGYVFRQSNPAVVGVEVQEGMLKSDTPLMNTEGKFITKAKGIQKEQKNVTEAKKNDQVSISLPHVMVGRQVKEGDVLLSAIPEEDFKQYKIYKQYLSNEEKRLLKEIANLMREKNPVWGV
jgi:translation initiation factor 5B